MRVVDSACAPARVNQCDAIGNGYSTRVDAPPSAPTQSHEALPSAHAACLRTCDERLCEVKKRQGKAVDDQGKAVNGSARPMHGSDLGVRVGQRGPQRGGGLRKTAR